MKHALYRLLLLLTGLLLLLSCTQTELPPPDTAVSETATAPAVTDTGTVPVPNVMPRTDGSTSTLPLDIAVHAAVLGISEEEATARVRHTKTYTALDNLMRGDCDVIFRTPLDEGEIAFMENSGFAYEAHPISADGFVFVVNADNPVDTLTEEQLRDIYTGKITNWSEVGGDDLPIIPYQRNPDSGSQNYMLSFMGDTPLAEPITEALPTTMSGILDAIVNYDNGIGAIGYSVYAYSDNMYADIAKIKYIRVNGVSPSLETIGDGSYPLRGYNYAIFDAARDADDTVRTLVHWMQSDEGQRVIAGAGYAPYRPIEDIVFPKAEALTPYTAVGTGIPTTDSDYDYEVRYLHAENFPHFADETVEKAVYDHLASENERLNAIPDAEIDAFLATRQEHTSAGHRKIECSIVNGYLSVLSSVQYMYGYEASPVYHYKPVGAVFDLYTGKRLSMSDLFPTGDDFVPRLNAHLMEAATKPFSGWGTRHEMLSDVVALAEGHFTYTADAIVFDPDDIFLDGASISLSPLHDEMSTSVPRDMEGILAPNTELCIYKTVRSSYSTGHGNAVEYPAGTNGDMLTVWLLDPENGACDPAVAKRVNEFVMTLYRDYFTEEAFLARAAKEGFVGEDVRYALGPFPDFSIAVIGNRYIEVTGANFLSIDREGDTSVSFGVLDGHTNPYSFSYYFDAKTGDALQLDAIFAAGWQEDCTVTDADGNTVPANTVLASGMTLTVSDIVDYITAPGNTGTKSDNDIPVTLTVCADGTQYTVTVPRMWIL